MQATKRANAGGRPLENWVRQLVNEEKEMSKPRSKTKGHSRGCGEKQKFDSLEKAEAASRRGRFDFMQAYKCRKCVAFHYGHPGAKQIARFSG